MSDEQPTPGAGGAADVDREAVAIWSRELAAELFAQPHVHHMESIERHMYAAVQAVASARTRALAAERDALRAAVEELKQKLARRADAHDRDGKALARLHDALPKTADGVLIVPGMTLYLECPDPEWWRLEPGAIVSVVADTITVGKGFQEYKGTHTICGEDVECGNLDCYSALDAARAALAAPGRA